MIARHEAPMDKTDVWSTLAAALPGGVISWRQDGKPAMRDGRHFARFVAYIEANTVRERLDGVVPGEWDLTLDLLPALPGADSDSACSFKARLQILGVIREDVGTGKDYKQAATDAFKRVAVRFGIGHELYGYEQNWVQVDGDGKYARPLEDPQSAYARRYGRDGADDSVASSSAVPVGPVPVTMDRTNDAAFESLAAIDGESPNCPKCQGRMWDNRATKRNPKAPDFKCRDRACEGVVWPPKGGPASRGTTQPEILGLMGSEEPAALALSTGSIEDVDDIPF